MKKAITLILIMLLVCSSLPALAAASPEEGIIEVVTATEKSTEATEAVPVENPGILPGSPFYFLKLLFEKIELLLTFSSEAKVQKLEEIAERRLAELNALPEDKQIKYAEKLTKAFVKALKKAGKTTEKVAEQTETVSEAVYTPQSRNLTVLQKVYEKVPEQARLAIMHAMTVSQKGKARREEVKTARAAKGRPPETVMETPREEAEEDTADDAEDQNTEDSEEADDNDEPAVTEQQVNEKTPQNKRGKQQAPGKKGR